LLYLSIIGKFTEKHNYKIKAYFSIQRIFSDALIGNSSHAIDIFEKPLPDYLSETQSVDFTS